MLMTIGYTLHLSVASPNSPDSSGRETDAQPKYTPESADGSHEAHSGPSTGRFAVGMPSSEEPRPKPEVTFPDMRRGNGGLGPESGPIVEGRTAAMDW